MGDELQATVGGDVGWNTVLGEYVEDKQLGEIGGGDGVVSWNEDGLFGEPVNND